MTADIGAQLGIAKGSGLVYTATVKAAEALRAALAAAGVSVMRYHGKLPAAELAQRATETVQASSGLSAFKPDDAMEVRRYGRGCGLGRWGQRHRGV